MRQPDYRSGDRQMGFVPGMKPPRTVQANTAPMGLGQPAKAPGPQAPPPGPPPPPPGPPPGPPPPPPGPPRHQVERQLWNSRHTRNPVAVLADAYTQALGQPPDYDTIDQLLTTQGVDGALLTLLGQDPDSLLQGVRGPSAVQRAILG